MIIKTITYTLKCDAPKCRAEWVNARSPENAVDNGWTIEDELPGAFCYCPEHGPEENNA